jgi:hypothetical protein
MTDQQRIEAMLKGLSELPPTRAISYRGCTSDAAFRRTGQSVVTRGLVATSGSPGIALAEGPAALYAILGNTGRHVAPFSARREENEIVFLPGTLFYLQSTLVIDDLAVHLVFELDTAASQRMPDELIDQLADRVRRTLADRPTTPIEPVPGKYVGDID